MLLGVPPVDEEDFGMHEDPDSRGLLFCMQGDSMLDDANTVVVAIVATVFAVVVVVVESLCRYSCSRDCNMEGDGSSTRLGHALNRLHF